MPIFKIYLQSEVLIKLRVTHQIFACSVAQRCQGLYSKCFPHVNSYLGCVRARLCGKKSCYFCEPYETQICVILQVAQAQNEQSSHVQVDRCAWGWQRHLDMELLYGVVLKPQKQTFASVH